MSEETYYQKTEQKHYIELKYIMLMISDTGS